MTPEDSLSVAVRCHLSRAGVMSEVKMFGGTGFMLNRHLVAAVSKRGLLLRVGKDRYRDALAWPGARSMAMRGRAMEGYVYIDLPVPTNDALKGWLDEAVAFVKTLPVKATGAKPRGPDDRRDRPCEAERATTAKAIAAYVSCGAARSAGHGARAAMVAPAGGVSQDGRRRRSPLATAASHEWRRGTLHKHWACPRLALMDGNSGRR